MVALFFTISSYYILWFFVNQNQKKTTQDIVFFRKSNQGTSDEALRLSVRPQNDYFLLFSDRKGQDKWQATLDDLPFYSDSKSEKTDQESDSVCFSYDLALRY